MARVNILLAAVFFLCSCGTSFRSEKDFYSYLNQEKNGILLKKKVGILEYTVKYIPAEFLAFSELKEKKPDNSSAYDSLVSLYRNSLTFIVTLQYEEDLHADLMKGSVTNYQEYSELVTELNFKMQDYLELSLDGKPVKPSIVRMEDSYGLQKHRNFYVVFPVSPDQVKKTSAVDVVYTDYLFDTGINHFVFDTENITAIPDFVL